MMRFLFTLFVSMMCFGFAAQAEEMPRMEDHVMLDLSAEDWVTTKTAHVTVNVEAAVNSTNAGTARGEMLKSVNDLVKTDWRLTAFNRSEDQTGLERWSATFEARVPEAQLSGLGEAVKKLSKAGMQLSVGNIDFSPTLEEMESARAALRTQIYKQAGEQLAALNTAIPGRNYRIALINFTGEDPVPVPMPHVVRGVNMAAMASAMPVMAGASGSPSVERAEKVNLTARVMFAAVPEGKGLLPVTDVKK
jgi:uncharacterized protein YggE